MRHDNEKMRAYEEENLKSLRAYEEKRQRLYFGLRSRVLSDEEMAEVEALDYRICVPMNESYNQHEKRIEFMNALVAQFRIRMAYEIAQKTLTNSTQADGAGPRKPLTNTTET